MEQATNMTRRLFKMRIVRIVTSMTCVVASATVMADNGEVISAERPGFSSSPIALGRGLLQIEGGFQFAHDGDGIDVDAHTLPLALLRVGVAERIELQVSWAGYSSVDVGGGAIKGYSDMGIGIKWQFTESDNAVPMALFAGVSLPTGNADFSSDSVDPTVGLFWTHSAELDWFGTVLVSEANGDVAIGNAVGISLPVSQDAGGYVEYFAVHADGSGTQHTLNGGLAFTPQRNLQYDVHAGLGLNERATDYFIGAGIAYRF